MLIFGIRRMRMARHFLEWRYRKMTLDERCAWSGAPGPPGLHPHANFRKSAVLSAAQIRRGATIGVIGGQSRVAGGRAGHLMPDDHGGRSGECRAQDSGSYVAPGAEHAAATISDGSPGRPDIGPGVGGTECAGDRRQERMLAESKPPGVSRHRKSYRRNLPAPLHILASPRTPWSRLCS